MSEINIEKSKVARDWKKIVEANPDLVFIPEELMAEAKAWNKQRNDLDDHFKKVVAKMQTETLQSLNEVMFKLRKYYEKAGITDIWAKDVGFQTEALKEGVYIIEITDQKPGAR